MMHEESIMVVNSDDDFVVQKSREHNHPMITFGVTEKARKDHPDVWASDIEADDNGHIAFTLHIRRRQGRVKIHSPGLHNCSNGCAAAAIAYAAGIDFDVIIAGLEDFRSAVNRMEFLTTPEGLNLLNDTYNANPASMASALDTLAALRAQSRAAVLGDMLELGSDSRRLHAELGCRAAASTVDYLGVIGNFAADIVEGAVDSGMSRERIIVFKEKQHAVDWIKELLHSKRLLKEDWLLVKASRGLSLDTIIQQLCEPSEKKI